jgi:hypothetical protein
LSNIDEDSKLGRWFHASRGKHVRTRFVREVAAVFSVLSIAVSPLILLNSQPASAYTIASSFNLANDATPGFGIYIDAPQVQNSYLNTDAATAASTTLTDFNNETPGIGSCPSTLAGGTVSGGCSVYSGAVEADLGASTTSSDPAFGGNGSRFATASSGGTTISFATPQKYLGLWWSAGSAGNQLDFYSDGALVSSITTANLTTLLGTATQSLTPTADSVTAVNGNTYSKSFYFGNPRGYPSATPTQTLYGSAYLPNESFTYIHAFANGGTSFDTVVMSGYGFEFDNIVSSTSTGLQPDGRLVPYSFYEARRVVRFDKNAPDAAGTMSPQTSLTGTNIAVRGFDRAGYDFYGWNTAADGTGTWYSDMGFYSFAADLRLYAQWQAKNNKPAIFGLGVRGDESTHTYARPDSAHGLAIDWQGLSAIAGDENWFLCDSPHTSPADYFLNAFPSDCTAYPYGSLAGGAGGNVNFPKSQMLIGKYIAYGMWAQNSAGATYAIQSFPDPIRLSIDGLTSNSALTRTPYTVTGYPTSTTAGWYRCDNAFVNDQTMPAGTCSSVSNNSLTYTPVLADIGKYMIYKATAAISGSSLTATKIVSGGPAVVMNSFVQNIFGDLVVNLTNSNNTAQLTPIPTHPDLNQIDGAWLICTSPASSYISGALQTAQTQVQTALITNAGCQPTGASQGATSIPVSPTYYGKYLLYFYMGVEVADNTKGLFVYRSTLVPTPTPTQNPSSYNATPILPSPSSSLSPSPSTTASPTSSPKPSNSPTAMSPSSNSSGQQSGSSRPATIHQSNGNIISVYPNGDTETPDETVITPTPITELPKIISATGTTKPSLSIFAPRSNPAIGATGDDAATPEDFSVLSSPAAAKWFTKNLGAIFALLLSLSIAGTAMTTINRRKKSNLAIPSSADVSSDPFKSTQSGWGDRLKVWNLGIATSIDKLSYQSVIEAAKISPFLSRIFNDGAYLRAIFGPLTIIGPVVAITLACTVPFENGGLLANQAWITLLVLSVLSLVDAFAGLVALWIYLCISWLTVSHTDIWQDLRVALGTALVVLGPVMVMTAFRTIRRQAARKFSEWWERFVDLAVGPFVAGWSASIFASTLPAIAGQTMALANHILLIAISVAAVSALRVLIEEFAARNYPRRMDKLVPDDIPDSSKLQKYASLILRFTLITFMIAGVLGNSWQLWVGSAMLLVPSVMSWYQDRIPNSPTLWRFIPTGIPGLAFSLSVISWLTAALSNLVINSEQLTKWAFAILPMPILLFSLLALMGRHGEDIHEVKPTKRNKIVYRVGGVVMLAVTMRLAGIY